MGYVGDQSAIDTLTFYNIMTSVAGLATLAMPIATSFPALAGLNAAYGFFISANFALTTVILVELVGVERLTDAYGIVSLAQGVANLGLGLSCVFPAYSRAWVVFSLPRAGLVWGSYCSSIFLALFWFLIEMRFDLFLGTLNPHPSANTLSGYLWNSYR